MKEYIDAIKGINDNWLNSKFNPPATAQQILEFEKEHSIQIPESYKNFLKLSNGAHIFGGDAFLYGVGKNVDFEIGYDATDGKIPEKLLILGFYRSSHICYDDRYDSFIFYEYEDYDEIKAECVDFASFEDVLAYMIDIATS